MRKNSIKNSRLSGEVMREVSDIIRNDIKDPRIHMMTSVTGAEVAPDLKTAKIYISVLGSDEEFEDTMTGLKKAAGFVRKELAHKMNLRYTPEITFLPDKSIEYGIKMSSMIDSLNSEKDDAED